MGAHDWFYVQLRSTDSQVIAKVPHKGCGFLCGQDRHQTVDDKQNAVSNGNV
jgi:hypothetical protein